MNALTTRMNIFLYLTEVSYALFNGSSVKTTPSFAQKRVFWNIPTLTSLTTGNCGRVLKMSFKATPGELGLVRHRNES